MINAKNQFSLNASLVFTMNFVAAGSLSLSPKNPVSTGITFTMRTVTQAAIPTTRRTG